MQQIQRDYEKRLLTNGCRSFRMLLIVRSNRSGLRRIERSTMDLIQTRIRESFVLVIVGEGGIHALFSTDHVRHGGGCDGLNRTCILISSDRKLFSYVFVIDQSSVGCIRRDILSRGGMRGSRFDSRFLTGTTMAHQQNYQEQDEHGPRDRQPKENFSRLFRSIGQQSRWK